MLNKGDKVVMHTCMEAEFHEGIVWNVSYEEFTRKGYGQHSIVFLEGFSGSFSTEYLRKVDPSEETVECIFCESQVLVESNGYVPDETLGTYWCRQCAAEEAKRQKVLKEVEQMKITHTVFKNEDIEKLTVKEKRELAYVESCLTEIRGLNGKEPYPKYIVINTDENPQMIEEIIQVMKRYRKWG